MNVRAYVGMVLVYFFFSVLTVSAADRSQGSEAIPMSFTVWKDQQILESQNLVVRLSNRIQLVKTGRYKGQDSNLDAQLDQADIYGDRQTASTTSSEGQSDSQQELLQKSERQLQQALENLQYAKELSLEDYLAVYLVKFKDNSEALSQLAGQLSQEEVSMVLQSLLRGQEPLPSPDAQRKGSSMVSEVKNPDTPKSL